MDQAAWDLIAPDGTRLGRLELTGGDMPWTYCRFAPSAAFGAVAPLFAAELELLNGEAMDEWEAAYERIAGLGLVLWPAAGGEPIREVLLHIDGDEAWFRY